MLRFSSASASIRRAMSGDAAAAVSAAMRAISASDPSGSQSRRASLGKGRLERDFHHVAEGFLAILRGQRLFGDQMIADRQHRKRAHAVTGGEVVKLGGLHLDAKDAVTG